MAGTSPAGTETLPYQYTSRDEMDSVFSEIGIQLRVDDLFSTKGPTDYLVDLIDEATDEVNMSLEWKYLPEDLVTHRLVRRWASIIACHNASRRRGNPKQLTTWYNEVKEKLQDIFDGRKLLPRVPLRVDFLPTYSNLVVDNRFPSPPQKISQGSTWFVGWW